LIDLAREELLLKSFRTTANTLRLQLLGIGIVEEHVHLALTIPPSLAVSRVVRDLKTTSTHLINHAAPLSDGGIFSWQREYAVFTFGERSLDDVISYVQNQKKHHALGTIRPKFERLDRLDRPTS
jgi:putative transposase